MVILEKSVFYFGIAFAIIPNFMHVYYSCLIKFKPPLLTRDDNIICNSIRKESFIFTSLSLGGTGVQER